MRLAGTNDSKSTTGTQLWRQASNLTSNVGRIASAAQTIKGDPSAFSKALSITRNVVILFDFRSFARFATCCGNAEAVIDLFQTFAPVFSLFGGKEDRLGTAENIAWSVVNLASAAAWAHDTKLSSFGRFADTDKLIKAGSFFGFTFLGLNAAEQMYREGSSVSKSAQLVWCVAEIALLVLPISGSARAAGMIFSKSAALVSFIYRAENTVKKGS